METAAAVALLRSDDGMFAIVWNSEQLGKRLLFCATFGVHSAGLRFQVVGGGSRVPALCGHMAAVAK